MQVVLLAVLGLVEEIYFHLFTCHDLCNLLLDLLGLLCHSLVCFLVRLYFSVWSRLSNGVLELISNGKHHCVNIFVYDCIPSVFDLKLLYLVELFIHLIIVNVLELLHNAMVIFELFVDLFCVIELLQALRIYLVLILLKDFRCICSINELCSAI